MCSGLQCDQTSWYLSKGLFHRFRCRCQFLFNNDLACFIHNTVERPAISQVQTNRELVSFENHVSAYPNSASLFHSRSPFLCALSTSNIGSVSHPAGDRSSHPICEVPLSVCGENQIPCYASGPRSRRLHQGPNTFEQTNHDSPSSFATMRQTIHTESLK